MSLQCQKYIIPRQLCQKIILVFMGMFLYIANTHSSDIIIQAIANGGKKYIPLEWDEIESMRIKEKNGGNILEVATKKGYILINGERLILHQGRCLPLVEITTKEEMDQIPDKENYQEAVIRIRDFKTHNDFTSEVSIKGRGNSSWTISDKKPYRLKFESKKSILDLNKAKSFVFIANWTDVSLIQNAMASFIGSEIFGMPFTHKMTPVDLILNGTYRGSYLLTNKPGINSGSVDIDEDNSVMWELDTYFDEDMKFYSPIFNLPVNLKDPDMSVKRFEAWKDDFIKMEEEISRGNVEEWIDIDSYAALRVVHDILLNNEISHPKSLKIYKTEGGKYKFGPLWDFDKAMGYYWDAGTSYNMIETQRALQLHPFLQEIEKSQAVKDKIKEKLRDFFNHEDEFLQFVNEYISTIKFSAERNNMRWESRGDWNENIEAMRQWLEFRLNYLRTKI